MKYLLSLIIFLCCWTGSLSALEIRLGPVVGWKTQAIEAVLEGPTDWFEEGIRPEVGVEVGLGPLGTQVLFPLGLTWESYGEIGLSWGVSLHGLVGTALTPTAFIWGAEGELRSEWSWNPGIALGLSVGVRYAGAHWDVPLHLVVEFHLADEHSLEPTGEKR